MPKIVPAAIAYTEIVIPKEFRAGARVFEAVREHVALQAQGEPAVIAEEYEVVLLMVVLDAIHHLAPELVLRTKGGRKILVYDHESVPLLRDSDIEEGFAKQAEHGKEIAGAHTPNLTLNLEQLWRETGGDIERALRSVRTLIRPAETATLIGREPALLFLLVQHLLYGLAGEVWYQEDEGSQPSKIR